MRVVIVTSEPRGAYHLSKLVVPEGLRHWAVCHLVPYREPLQGHHDLEVSSSLRRIDESDLLIVTGGDLSAWSHCVATYANSRGVPVFYSQVSLGVPSLECSSVSFVGSSFMSLLHLESAPDHVVFDHSVITGNLHLDSAASREKKTDSAASKSALLLSTSDSQERDPALELRSLATALTKNGWRVVVRPHPREDVSVWTGFEIDCDTPFASQVAESSAVAGYPGSMMPLVGALGVPSVVLAPSMSLSSTLSNGAENSVSARVSSFTEALDLLESGLEVADEAACLRVCGPVGGASSRLFKAWSDFCDRRAQIDYDSTESLQNLLSLAHGSETVERPRPTDGV